MTPQIRPLVMDKKRLDVKDVYLKIPKQLCRG